MARLKAKHLYDLNFLSGVTLSRSGQHVAAVHSHIEEPEKDKDQAAPRYQSHIHLYDIETGDSTQLTYTGKSNSSPKFSPDGKQLAFLSEREDGDKAQLYLLNLSGGEAERLTDFKTGVDSFLWHPKGKQLAVVSRGDADDKAREGKPEVVTRRFYKLNGLGFFPQDAAQIFLFNLKKRESEQVGKLRFSPESACFSADGKHLYYVSQADAQAFDALQDTIYRLELKSGKTKVVMAEPDMGIGSLMPSPDGKRLAFFSSSEPGSFAPEMGIWLLENSKPRLLSADAAVAPSIGGDAQLGAASNKAVWLDDKTLLVNYNRAGQSSLATLAVDTLELTPWDDERRAVTQFDHANGVAAYVVETTQTPGELYIYKDGQEHKLSSLNDAFVKKYGLESASDPITFDADGQALTYWTLQPDKPRKDKALVLQVHGGPHTNYGYGFYFEFHMLAAAGYTVIYGNPRGSSSFGNTFATAALGDYGGVDADDCLAIAQHARKTLKRKRAPMHLTGGSYGGFMTNWLVGHTDEFASAVTQRSISNWLSFYGTSDIGYSFTERETLGNPWQDTDKLWQQSPLKYVANVKTPTLVIHAEDDLRCPIEQAEQFYIALKTLGVDTKFIRFPGETHELSRSGRPDRRVARLEAILEWFQEHP